MPLVNCTLCKLYQLKHIFLFHSCTLPANLYILILFSDALAQKTEKNNGYSKMKKKPEAKPAQTDKKKSTIKVYWTSKSDGNYRVDLSFDGIPFVLIGEKVLECHHGKDRNITHKQKYQLKASEKKVKFQILINECFGNFLTEKVTKHS